MSDYLVRHAKKRVWCTPDQDWQVQLKPAKVSPKNGARRTVRVIWDELVLPSKEHYYHVYQIGQMDQKRIGPDVVMNKWIPLTDHCHTNNLIVDLYCENGIQYPRCLAYLYVNKDRNILIAVRNEYRVPVDLNVDPLYVRFYANAYFSSDRADPTFDEIVVRGKKIETANDNILLQHDYLKYVAKHGITNAFVNGKLVDTLGPTTTAIGDIAEFVYDSTVKLSVEIPIKSLSTYDSLLDLKRKYLVDFDHSDLETMEYRDDVDFYLLVTKGLGKYQGVYYHKNQEDSVRMVTHRDYSIPVPYVTGFVTKHDFIKQVDDLTLRIHVRHSGYARKVGNEHHRLRDLYRLNHTDRRRAFLGVDSVVPEWRADNLEQSAYNAVMRAKEKDIVAPLVEEAYGYHAASTILADTPARVISDPTRNYVELPVGLMDNSTHYEYDAAGVLLGTYLHTTGSRYYPRHVECKTVESIVGLTKLTMDTTYGNDPVTLNPEKGYRFYRSPITGGRVTDVWEEVTGSDAYTIVNGNLCVWKHNPGLFYGLVKSDAVNLGYTLTLRRRDGLYRFSIVSAEPREGELFTKPLPIPPGKLDLWLNGHALIENLDYIVHWPEVVITNKRWLVQGDQVITVRGIGHCTPSFERILPPDTGFVNNEELSRNDQFDLRDDRIVRVVVGGSVRLKDEFRYGEDRIPTLPGVINGTPYAVEHFFSPIHEFLVNDPYDMWELSKQVDERIAAYLSLKLPEREIPTPNFIPERYEVYSPFCAKVMFDMAEGLLGGEEIRRDYSDQDVVEWLTDYEWLLKYDPTKEENLPPEQYVCIHPHPLYVETELDIYQYTFLERVIRLFLNNRVDISRFIRIGLPTS